MYTQIRTINHILTSYTAHVRACAIKSLVEHGFNGIEPISDPELAPYSLPALKAFWDQPNRPKKFPVYTGGNDRTVYDDPTVNLLFRAWHDILHVTLDQPFTREGEAEVARHQAMALVGIDKKIITSDVVDQYDYFTEHGEYVEDQRKFVIEKVFG